jgi:threonine/homoserine/homoserine lactone efflux protein
MALDGEPSRLLAVVHAVLDLVWFVLIIVGADDTRRWLVSAHSVRVVDAFGGTALVAMRVRPAPAGR